MGGPFLFLLQVGRVLDSLQSQSCSASRGAWLAEAPLLRQGAEGLAGWIRSS